MAYSRRYGPLTYPLTAEQIQNLNLELAAIERALKTGDVQNLNLSNLDADNLTSGTVPDARLINTGVTPGTYGDATHVSQVTVDAKGRVTGAADVAITGASTTVVACSLFNSTSQTLTSGTEAALAFDSADYDGSGLHNDVTNNTRVTIPAGLAGVFTVKGRVKFTSAFAGTVHVRVYKNGSLVTENTASGSDLSSGNEYHEACADLNLAVTDYVEIKVLVELAAGSGTIATAGGTGNTQFQARAGAAVNGGGGLPVTTAKGDVLASNGTAFQVVGVGANGTVLTADSTQTDGVKWGTGGKIVQVVNSETGSVATGTTQIASNNTTPTNTQGDQYMSLSITPTSATNKLRIEVVGFFTVSTPAWVTAALFQDATTNALAAFMAFAGTAGTAANSVFVHTMTAGTTSSTTFKVRAGIDRTGTVTFNGASGTGLMGGVLASSITITEIVP